MTARIEAQVERFAPGFRDRILARSAWSPADFARYNPNYPGGDVSGGVTDLRQLFFRPVARIVPYATPARGIYLCSSSTPPGAGVHGLCGLYAARAALRQVSAKRRKHAGTRGSRVCSGGSGRSGGGSTAPTRQTGTSRRS